LIEIPALPAILTLQIPQIFICQTGRFCGDELNLLSKYYPN